jgi:hypothetical protein
VLYLAFEINLGKIAGFGRRTILAHQAGDRNGECPRAEQSDADHTLMTSVAMQRLDPPDHLPLPALLSQALVAFTIEFDNEFERQVPHRTTNHGATAGAHHLGDRGS